jgi:hypothetical protein
MKDEQSFNLFDVVGVRNNFQNEDRRVSKQRFVGLVSVTPRVPKPNLAKGAMFVGVRCAIVPFAYLLVSHG